MDFIQYSAMHKFCQGIGQPSLSVASLNVWYEDVDCTFNFMSSVFGWHNLGCINIMHSWKGKISESCFKPKASEE